MVYNRCVGTRYCANNCPFKVRRFNWFNYAHADPMERLVLNPDVTVRSRGVMEKCSLCHHRIQDAVSEAKRQGRSPGPAELQTACQQSCPAKAITFGDANDPSSDVAARMRDGRFYHVLPELNLKAGVGYLARVKNGEARVKNGEAHGKDAEEGATHGG
jgi:molybdopterin-containing oxidoreductase family iron-sulfur binding subunit